MHDSPPNNPDDPNASPPAADDSNESSPPSEPSGAGAPPPPGGGAPPPGAGAPPPTEPPPAADVGGPPPPVSKSQNRTLMLVLAYLWILALIPLLVETEDDEIQWHSKHGIILTVFWIVVSVVLTILTTLTGGILGCITCFYPLVVIGVHIYLMIQAVNGKRVKLPVVSDFVDQWK